MIQIVINIVFLIISGVLYFVAPDIYSYEFCSLIAVLFLIQNVLYFVFRKDRNIVGFAILFAIAFGLTNFIYPVFYYLKNPEFSMFAFPFNKLIISRCTAIAYVGYTVYMLVMNIIETNSESSVEQTNIQDFDFSKVTKIVYVLLLTSVAVYIAMGGHKILASVYSGDGILEEQGITGYIYVLIASSAILLSVFMFRNGISKTRKILYIVSICCLIILFLALGSRTLPLMLALCSIIAFNNDIRKISVPLMLLFLVIGAGALTFIVYARTTSVTSQNYVQNALSTANIEMIWDLGFDLIINNRNLYALIDYADK